MFRYVGRKSFRNNEEKGKEMNDILINDIDYEPIYEGFIEELKNEYKIEILENDIHWCGFGNQGDGLSFDFKVSGNEAIVFLNKVQPCLYQDIIDIFNVGLIDEIEIYTEKNHFANFYCHQRTRELNLDVKFSKVEETELFKSFKNKIITVSENYKLILSDISTWYENKCLEKYSLFEQRYYEEMDGIEDEEIEVDREEWDDEITISDRIDSLIDPEMNIFKVREMFDEANDLSNTKNEASYLIDKFVENFDKDYLIIKKLN